LNSVRIIDSASWQADEVLVEDLQDPGVPLLANFARIEVS